MKEYAKEHGSRSTTGAFIGMLRHNRMAAIVGAVSLAAASGAATIGIEKTIAAGQRSITFGNKTTEKLKPLTGQLEAAEHTIDNFFDTLRAKVDRLILIEGDPKSATPEERRAMSGKSGKGPQWAGKRCLLTGVCSGETDQQRAAVAKAEEFRATLRLKGSDHIVDYLKSLPETTAFLASRKALYQQIAIDFPKLINDESSIGFLLRFVDSGDPYLIPKAAEKGIKTIKSFDKDERDALVTTYKKAIAEFENAGMAAIGATNQEISLPEMRMNFDTSALQSIIDEFPKGSTSWLPTKKDLEFIGQSIREQGLKMFDENNQLHVYLLFALIFAGYMRVADMNFTVRAVKYEGARRRQIDKELPEKLRQLREAEDIIVSMIASVVEGEFAQHRKLLLGDAYDIPEGSAGTYLRYELTQSALRQSEINNKPGVVMSTLASAGSFIRSAPPSEVDEFNNIYLEYLNDWQKKITDNPSALNELITQAYPDFAKWRLTMDQMIKNFNEPKKHTELLETFRNETQKVYADYLSARSEYLQYRIVATRHVVETLKSEKPTSVEALYESDVLKVFDGDSSVPVLRDEAKLFNMLATLANRLSAEEQEFEQIRQSGIKLWMREWKQKGGRLQIPPEFESVFVDSALGATKMGIPATILDATARELMRLDETDERDHENMAEQLTTINETVPPALNVKFTDFKSLPELQDIFSKTNARFSLSLDRKDKIPVFTMQALDEEGRTVATVTYPEPLPNTDKDSKELARSIEQWFNNQGLIELEARARFTLTDRAYWEMRKKYEQYPDLIVPLNVDTKELTNFVELHHTRNYQHLAIEELQTIAPDPMAAQADERVWRRKPLTQSQINAFRKPNLTATGFTVLAGGTVAIESIFNEIMKSLPKGFSAAYDITRNELLISKGSYRKDVPFERIGMAEYESRRQQKIDEVVKKISDKKL